MRKRNPSHAAAVAVGIAACANDKMLGHGAILEANAERSTPNAEHRIQTMIVSVTSEPIHYQAPQALKTSLHRLLYGRRTSVGAELWFLSCNFFISAFGGHVVAKSANAGLGDYKFAASKF